MRKFLKHLKRKFFKVELVITDIEYQVGNFRIQLPFSHKLPEYQRTYKNYDKKLTNIVQCIDRSKYDGVIIDIGANVGDTAALIRSCTESKIYCVEGDVYYLSYLRKNIQNLNNISIIDSYVAGNCQEYFGEIERNNGTAKIKLQIDGSNNAIQTKELKDIISENNIDINSVNLIKIDTDGFDFAILLGNKELIERYKPNLFFEYDISFGDNDSVNSLELIELLEKNGYLLVVYDNFGNLLEFCEKEHLVKFKMLNHYLESCRENGGGIYYLDVFATINKEIVSQIIANDFI